MTLRRCRYGLQHASYLAYENPYHRRHTLSVVKLVVKLVLKLVVNLPRL